MIYIYKKFVTTGHYSGIGYVIDLFLRTFPEADILSQPQSIGELGANDILIFPRVFTHTLNVIEPETYFLMHTKAKIVQSVFWDLEAVPRCVAQSIGRADLIHAPSRFVAKLFRPHDNICVFPIPPAEYPKRSLLPNQPTIGAVIASTHGRKNISGYARLAQELPKWNFRIVLTPLWRENEHQQANIEKLMQLPNVTVLTNISDSEMIDFYHSLTWFVVLSGGEAYYLPLREALKCGVPVIAPNNSSFSELQGVPGVFLVSTALAPTAETPDVKGLPLRFPQINEVVKVVETVAPPKPQDITPGKDVLPSFADWREFWLAKIDELQSTRTVWSLLEYPAFFALHNTNFVLGLNDVSKRWARKTGSATFCLYGDLPAGVRAPIIVPYSHGFSDWMQGTHAPPILVALSILRRNNPEAPIVLWVHNTLPQTLSSVLYPYVDLLCGTTLTMVHQNKFLKAYLPHPIGNPPSPDAVQDDYFVVWGMNCTALAWLEVFFKHFPHRIYFNFTFSIELPEGAFPFLRSIMDKFGRSRKIIVDYGLPKDDDELEQILDSAMGYICIDFYYSPITTGEASARIPHVLRKGKPIIANDSSRNLEWGGYINLIKFSEKLLNADEQSVAHFARSISENLDYYIPSKVPSVEQELMQFQSVIEQAIAARKENLR